MKSYELLEGIGEAQDSYIIDAKAPKKKPTPVWVKWAAMAACLCLIISLVIPIYMHNKPGSGNGPGQGGEGITPGGVPGDWSGDIDPTTASIAVFPDTEELKNVASATLTDIDEKSKKLTEIADKYYKIAAAEYEKCKNIIRLSGDSTISATERDVDVE